MDYPSKTAVASELRIYSGRRSVNNFRNILNCASVGLKTLLYQRLESLNCSFSLGVSVMNDVDAVLKQSGHVVSTDSVILDNCQSWINLTPDILKDSDGVWMVDLRLF